MVERAGGKAGDAAAEALRQLVARGNEGWGTEGTVPKRETKVFRILAILTQVGVGRGWPRGGGWAGLTRAGGVV
jgi:hypothetical protein